ncbi:hypothetical protein Tco_0095052 [Tanacetum coccineum]
MGNGIGEDELRIRVLLLLQLLFLLMLARIRVGRIHSFFVLLVHLRRRRRSGSGFAAGSIRAEEVTYASLEEIYVPEWTVTKGFELNDGHSCANMIDHFTPPTFFKTVRRMKHEQLFVEFNVSAARNLSLSS